MASQNHSLIFSLHSPFHNPFRASGPHRIATFLREHDWDVEVIDYANEFTSDELQELIKSRISSKTIFIGLSTFFNFWDVKFNQLTLWIKQTYPDIKIVLGGQSIAKTPAENIDYWIDSFGEYAILELVKNLTGNGNTIKFDLEHFGQKKLIKSVSSYPAFPMQSLKIIMEKRDFLEPFEWLTNEFGRGCKFKCKFCNFPVLGVKGDHTRSSEDFIYNMKYNYDNFGIKNYFVADETFNETPEKIKKFADATDQLNFRPYFSGFMRADLLISHTETWEDLVRLNFGGHYYGIETFNHESAKLIGKGMHPDKIKQGLLDIKSYFKPKLLYRGTASIIVGLPHETLESVVNTRNWFLKNWFDQALHIFPFDVEDVTGENLKNQTNISEFGKNIFKYGIRKMPDDNYKKLNSGFEWEWRHGNYAADKLIWEHDTMNIFQADALSKELQDLSSTVFKMDNWNLNQANKELIDREYTYRDINLPREKMQFRSKPFINYLLNYKYKKLSYSL